MNGNLIVGVALVLVFLAGLVWPQHSGHHR